MKKKKTKKLWYCILILLFGSIGIHKFYSGHSFIGFVYMALCWTGISEILTIFDLIGALMKESDANGYILV